MDQDFVSMFDRVVVGLASPASVAANHIYPALWVASLAHKFSKLTIMVDTPEPHKLWSGLTSAAQNRGTLVKDFYARRKGFREAVVSERQAVLQGFVEALVVEEWPLTVAPALPWTDTEFLTRHIPRLADSRSLGLKFDEGLDLPFYNPMVEPTEHKIWYADSSASSWTQRVAGTLSHPVQSLRQNRMDTIVDVSNRIRGSLGLLATTHRGNEPWWTPTIMIALSQRVPVVSEWRYTSLLGPEWSQLAASVELMTFEDRREFAREQAKIYSKAVPKFSEESALLVRAMSLADTTH